MDIKEVIVHTIENGKYKMQFEKAASANKIDGFKVEVNADSFDEAKREAELLYDYALAKVEANKPTPPIPAVK